MRRNEMTRMDAAHEWVREFNAIQQGMLEPFMNDGTLSEVTVPVIGDRVFAYHEPVEEPMEQSPSMMRKETSTP